MFNSNLNITSRLASRKSGIVSIGSVLNETTWASLSNYTNVGTGISVSGGQLNMTGGTASFNDYLIWNDVNSPWLNTCLEKWTVSVKCITPTISASSYGIGIGIRGTNTFAQMSAVFRWGWDSGSPAALFMYPLNSLTNQLSSGTFTSPGSATTVWFDVTRNKNVYTVTGYQSDHTTVLKTATFTMSLTSGAVNQSNNTGQWVLENFGGTNLKVLEWNITTPAQKNCDIVWLGDSNMYGMFSGSNAVRFAEAASVAKGKSFEILAGIGDRTSDLITRLNEVRALNPGYVILSIGRNDVSNGVSIGTIQTNINTILSTLTGWGIPVKLGGVIASNVDVTNVQAHYNTKPNQKIDSFQATKDSGTGLFYNSGDNIHMNATGNGVLSTLYQTIL